MKIVVQQEMLLIRTDFATLKSPWMAEFLSSQSEHMLYLPRAVLILPTKRALPAKQTFFQQLCHHYVQTHDLEASFFMRSLERCAETPVKVELEATEEPVAVSVELYAHDANTVTASLYAPNPWVIDYLRSQLDPYVTHLDAMQITFDLSSLKAKSRLERALNKRHVLHYHLQFRYDTSFMSRLYAEYAEFGFDVEEDPEQIDAMLHYYTVLECPVGASQDALRKSYKKLVKVYHPDRVHCENDAIVNRYTQKFQLLQEAYSALRIVS